MTSCTPRARRAFTLIELLVVIAVIALLMSILLPALGQAREQSRRVTCSTNVRAVLLASRMYMDSSGYYVHPQLFPDQLSNGKFIVDTGQPDNKADGAKLVPSDERYRVWDCPDAVKQRTTWHDPARQGWDVRYQFMSYGANDWGIGELTPGESAYFVNPTGMFADYGDKGWWGVRESMVDEPANFICFGESNRDGNWDQIMASCIFNGDWCWDGGETPGAIHPKGRLWGVNTGFMDGHVAWYATFRSGNIDKTNPMDKWKVAGILLADTNARVSRLGDRQVMRKMWIRQRNSRAAR